jgi:hypothetical protein
MQQDSSESHRSNPDFLVINRYYAELARAAQDAFSDSGEINVVVDRRQGERQLDADGVAYDELQDLFLEC